MFLDFISLRVSSFCLNHKASSRLSWWDDQVSGPPQSAPLCSLGTGDRSRHLWFCFSCFRPQVSVPAGHEVLCLEDLCSHHIEERRCPCWGRGPETGGLRPETGLRQLGASREPPVASPFQAQWSLSPAAPPLLTMPLTRSKAPPQELINIHSPEFHPCPFRSNLFPPPQTLPSSFPLTLFRFSAWDFPDFATRTVFSLPLHNLKDSQ